jgi:hypothetical protein
LPDPDDEGESGKETEGFSGEAHGAEARWNDHKRPHYPPVFARTDAKVTLRNIPTGWNPINLGGGSKKRATDVA